MDSDLRFLGFRNTWRAITASAVLLGFAAATPACAESPDALSQNRCAGLGGDFVAASGQRGCVRIGGHIRAETAHGRAMQATYPPEFNNPLVNNPLADGVRQASEAFHVRAGSPGGDILPR